MESAKLKIFKKIFEKMQLVKTVDEKIEILLSLSFVQKEFEKEELFPLYQGLEKEPQLIFLLVTLFEQGHLLHMSDYKKFLEYLCRIERHYQEIGGVFGYFLKAMKSDEKQEIAKWNVPKFLSIENLNVKTIELGCRNLSKTAVAVPLGGMGQRLGYRDEEGPLPVAQFPFLGHSLLAQIIRDLEGLEALYFSLFHEIIEIPLILMCSKDKSNESKVKELLEHEVFFGRKKIKLIAQELVPVITEEGHFSFDGKDFFCFPSGHGAIWKLAKEEKVFEWLEELGIHYLILRQINNPLAALDNQFCAFLGACIENKSSFGFVGLKRILGLSEGVIVEKRVGNLHFITNVEYVEIAQTPIHQDLNYLANANILFANVDAIRKKMHQNLLCGLIVNRKHIVPQVDKNKEIKWVKGAAVEGMMQNLSEIFAYPLDQPLPVLVMKMDRKKTMSAIKTLEGERETPLVSTYNFLKNSYNLLCLLTKEELQPFSTFEEFKMKGANYTFTYHPALGPFYDRIKEKLSFQKVDEKSVLELEIQELKGEDLILEGHLKISGGKCTLKRIKIVGKCEIEIDKGGSLFSEDLEIIGEHTFKVLKDENLLLIRNEQNELKLIANKSSITKDLFS